MNNLYFSFFLINNSSLITYQKNKAVEELARKMILVGLWCIQSNPADRPSMDKVVDMLEGSHQVIQVPPKPFPSSPMGIR